MQKKLFQCPICKLHYDSVLWAKKCEEWCSNHNSCNLAITTHAIERERNRENG